MGTETRILSIGLDGPWSPMDLARLLHLSVRYYRLEQLVWLAETGGRNVFDSRLDAVVLKYLAAFDWLAAPLMSARYNDSFEQSEAFVAELGLGDLRLHAVRYTPPGAVEFAGMRPIVEGLHGVFDAIRRVKEPTAYVTGDSPEKLGDIEALYAANIRRKANLMRHAGYSDAELHAIVSPSLEDLHFISNMMTQGRIGAVEKRAPAG
jgi:hypothetical protein